KTLPATWACAVLAKIVPRSALTPGHTQDRTLATEPKGSQFVLQRQGDKGYRSHNHAQKFRVRISVRSAAHSPRSAAAHLPAPWSSRSLGTSRPSVQCLAQIRD